MKRLFLLSSWICTIESSTPQNFKPRSPENKFWSWAWVYCVDRCICYPCKFVHVIQLVARNLHMEEKKELVQEQESDEVCLLTQAQ